MAEQKSIATIINIAEVSQYLARQDEIKRGGLFSGSLSPALSERIYTEKKSVKLLYNVDPGNSTLRGAANYLYTLCDKFAATAEDIIGPPTDPEDPDPQPPIITGPNNITVPDGTPVTFSVSVTSTLPVTRQWYRNGAIVPGAIGNNLSLTAHTADSGDVFSVIATNSAGSTSSQNAVLTVTMALNGYLHYGDVDPYPNLSTNVDDFEYQQTFAVTHSQPLTIDLPPAAGNNKFLIVKYPAAEGVKTAWSNTPLNNGVIPDSVMRAVMNFGGYMYVVTRNASSFDTDQSLIIS